MQNIRSNAGFYVPEFWIVIAALIVLTYVAVPTFMRVGKCASLEGSAIDQCVRSAVKAD